MFVLVSIGVSFTAPVLLLPLSTHCCLFHPRFTTQRPDTFTTLSKVLFHESTKRFFPLITFLYPYAAFTFPSYSLVDPVCFHVHPRFCLTSFETSIIIIITPYHTPLYFHSTRSWYIGLLHWPSSALLGLLCGFSPILHSQWMLQSSSHAYFSQIHIPLTPSLFTFTTTCVSYPGY